jgi:hypothetical protein
VLQFRGVHSGRLMAVDSMDQSKAKAGDQKVSDSNITSILCGYYPVLCLKVFKIKLKLMPKPSLLFNMCG